MKRTRDTLDPKSKNWSWADGISYNWYACYIRCSCFDDAYVNECFSIGIDYSRIFAS